MRVQVSGREWTFDPDRNDGGILVDRVDNDMPEYRPGKTYQFDLVFFENTDDNLGIQVESGGTLGGSEGFVLGGPDGATTGSIQGPGGNIDRYQKVREYTRWAGRYTMTKAIDGTPRISEHTPSGASIDSIVVELVPGQEVEATDGLWVILDDVDDQTRFVKDTARIGVRATVLARSDQYGSRSALKDDLGSDLV